MKKYLALIIITTMLIVVAISIPVLSELTARDTETAYVFSDDYIDSIVCSGKIINSENITIESSYSFIVKKVCVAVGDRVSDGDTLITIDKEATAQLYSTYSQDESTVIDQIPDEIKAEQNGKISKVNIKSGSAVIKGKELIVINGDNNLSVKININENLISNIEIGQPVQITGNAFGDYVYTGVLTELAKKAKTISTGTTSETIVEGYVDIDNPDSKLKSGYTVKATIITNTVKNAVIVPYEAVVQDDDNNNYVYKIVGCWAVKQFFKEADETSAGIVVSSGINLNDTVAVNLKDSDMKNNCFRIKTGNDK
ncbi:MAG: HlyD family efflux transporter periplasmic adaptor subunit [Oscillospiraceae bacterium]|nr:HlyD family efflux transporter periplasmic adaptor subunit [Oscillospiraceae bacterium]